MGSGGSWRSQSSAGAGGAIGQLLENTTLAEFLTAAENVKKKSLADLNVGELEDARGDRSRKSSAGDRSRSTSLMDRFKRSSPRDRSRRSSKEEPVPMNLVSKDNTVKGSVPSITISQDGDGAEQYQQCANGDRGRRITSLKTLMAPRIGRVGDVNTVDVIVDNSGQFVVKAVNGGDGKQTGHGTVENV